MRRRPVLGAQCDLAADGQRARLVFARAGGPRLHDREVGLRARPAEIAAREEPLREIGGEVIRPPPAVGAEGVLVHADLRLLPEGDRPVHLTKVQVIEADVDERADLDVGILDPPPDVGRFAVELERAPEIAELLVEPPQRVQKAALDEPVLKLARAPQAALDGRPGLGELAERDLRQADEGDGEELVEAVVNRGRDLFRSTQERNRGVELCPPVGVGPQPDEVLRDHLRQPEPLGDLE